MNAYRPDPLVVQEQARLRRRRGAYVLALAGLLLLGVLLPHVHLSQETGFGRSLLPTSFYFLHVQSGTFGASVDQPGLAIGFNVTYLGLALHQLGLLLAVPTFWSLYPDEMHPWIYRLLVISGWLLTFSAPLVFAGVVVMEQAGVPAALGVAWVPELLSGLAITFAARRGKSRIDRTWYVAKPELM